MVRFVVSDDKVGSCGPLILLVMFSKVVVQDRGCGGVVEESFFDQRWANFQRPYF